MDLPEDVSVNILSFMDDSSRQLTILSFPQLRNANNKILNSKDFWIEKIMKDFSIVITLDLNKDSRIYERYYQIISTIENVPDDVNIITNIPHHLSNYMSEIVDIIEMLEESYIYILVYVQIALLKFGEPEFLSFLLSQENVDKDKMYDVLESIYQKLIEDMEMVKSQEYYENYGVYDDTYKSPESDNANIHEKAISQIAKFVKEHIPDKINRFKGLYHLDRVMFVLSGKSLSTAIKAYESLDDDQYTELLERFLSGNSWYYFNTPFRRSEDLALNILKYPVYVQSLEFNNFSEFNDSPTTINDFFILALYSKLGVKTWLDSETLEWKEEFLDDLTKFLDKHSIEAKDFLLNTLNNNVLLSLMDNIPGFEDKYLSN